jgi:hypothetical protein
VQLFRNWCNKSKSGAIPNDSGAIPGIFSLKLTSADNVNSKVTYI